MNKLMGFYELKELNIPTIPWQKYTPETDLEEGRLWTLRVAVRNGNDVSLPRFVGVTAAEARAKGRELLDKYGESGLVIYYPYFIADKSGVMDISDSRTILEAVDKDLWNLVTHGRRDVTILASEQGIEYIGKKDFLSPEELSELLQHAATIRAAYRSILGMGKSVIAEWSFAFNTDTTRRPIGGKYLVFYELRSV